MAAVMRTTSASNLRTLRNTSGCSGLARLNSAAASLSSALCASSPRYTVPLTSFA
eukprot:CAMPEP_0198339226 /NCGR_PEP_ID=MMETSP1450-20131203/38528_1 /TAXON_ID=753684 ORGANISM="Madagascaria erythrocladiodes, Strain CCMP3234" /NCGR_SAMPLE_ID=MMETSP1450 /ASSEMBLY_ACC=CAM_ASM_001115 /LENGTH=54 /DNA_ID=CAMNT_0044044135 /DNA_START=15 /DNA_END=175 /DNA_ORIENTATION=+